MSRILNPLSGSYQNRTPLTRYENEGNRAPSSTSSSGQYGFYYRVLLSKLDYSTNLEIATLYLQNKWAFLSLAVDKCLFRRLLIGC